MRRTSYDQRQVRFEEIHGVRSDDLLEFVKLGRIQNGYRILDVGCGYGAVTGAIIDVALTSIPVIQNLGIDLVDESQVQIQRASHEIAPKAALCADSLGLKVHFVAGTFPSDFPDWHERYDVIYAKQVIHEVPAEQQIAFVRALFSALRPGGSLVVWEIALDEDKAVADLFRRTIHEKDRLAEYDTLVANRHFLDRSDLLQKLQFGGGLVPTVVRTIQYRFRSHLRLAPELKSNVNNLRVLNRYIQQEYDRLPKEKQTKLAFSKSDDSVDFDVPVVITSALKPTRATLNSLCLFSDQVFEGPRRILCPNLMEQNAGTLLRREVLQSAILAGPAQAVFAEIGPSLVRVTLVERDKQRRPVLVRSGLDFIFHWGREWNTPARAYLAYLASLFAAAGQDAERSFLESATGLLARWFTRYSEAAIAHFELDQNMLRVTALTIANRIFEERAFALPARWHKVLDIFHRLVKQKELANVSLSDNITRLCGSDEYTNADALAESIASSAPFGNQLLNEAVPKITPAPPELSGELILRVASYLALANYKHAYYLLPPALVFKKTQLSVPPERLEVGNLHIATIEAIDPKVAIDVLHWQSAAWQSLAAADVLIELIKVNPNI